MTEQEWMACSDPEKMLEFLRGRVSDRKLRLCSVACFRKNWHLLTYQRIRDAVVVLERYADEMAGDSELSDAALWVAAAKWQVPGGDARIAAFRFAKVIASPLSWDSVIEVAWSFSSPQLMHDIFGNPFRPVAINPTWLAWNDGTVLRIALSIYDERSFDRMPILADALEDAGCDNEELLCHCRSEGPHVRGCWAVDLILRKE